MRELTSQELNVVSGAGTRTSSKHAALSAIITKILAKLKAGGKLPLPMPLPKLPLPLPMPKLPGTDTTTDTSTDTSTDVPADTGEDVTVEA